MAMENQKNKTMRNLNLTFIIASILYISNISSQTIYITESGKKYHINSCRFLKKSKKEIDITKAKRLGYLSCNVCKPKLHATKPIKIPVTNQSKTPTSNSKPLN